MDTDFLRRVIPPNAGYFFLWAMDDRGGPKDKKNHSTGYRAARVDTAQHFLKHEQVSATHGVFYTPFTFVQSEWKADSSGKRRHPRSFPELMLECRAFWLDIDIGGAGEYPDDHTALKAVLQACTEDTMPAPSAIVRSGGGLHLYWLMATPLGYEDWCHAARRFKQYWMDAGVLFDRKCTADPARILRVPGTPNHKIPDSPRDTKVLSLAYFNYDNAFIDQWPEVSEKAVAVEQRESIRGLFHGGDESDLSTGVGTFKAYTRNIVQRCEVFRRAAANNGADCSEPLWKDILQTVKMTEDAEDWVHELSKGHPGYNAVDTEEKYAQRNLGKGITCEGFSDHFAAGEGHPCAGCPLQGKGFSPLKFGGDRDPALVEEREPLEGQPLRLLISDNGMVVRKQGKKADDEPVLIPVSHSVLTCVEALQEESAQGLNPYLRLHHITGGRRHRRLLNLNALASATDGKREMNRAGLAIPGSVAYSEMSEIMTSWFSQLAQAGKVAHLNRTQGWLTQPNGAIEGFVVGDKVYYPDGACEDTGSLNDDGHVTTYTPTGQLEPWQEAAQAIIDSGNGALVAMLAASFAAPLGRLMGNSGYCASLSMYSPESGVGKSTALRVARAVWAQPNSFAVLDDTYNGVMATLKNAPYLPLMWDDPRKAKTRTELRELLFQVAAGRTKQRSNMDGSAAGVVKMHTIGIVTSNEPLMGELSSTTGAAEAKRVLEVRVPSMQLTTPDKVFSALDDNYGHAGGLFAQYVVTHLSEIRKALASVKEHIRGKIGHDASDRFYANTLTTCVVAASIARRIGLVEFDVSDLTSYLLAAVEETRLAAENSREDVTCENDILQYLASARVQGGVVDVFSHRGRNGAQQVEIIRRPADPNRPWDYVVEDSTGCIRLTMASFEEWYERKYDRKMNRPGWFERAHEEGILVERAVRRSLAIGTLAFSGYRHQQVMVVRLPGLVNGLSETPKVLPPSTAPVSDRHGDER